MPRPAGRSATRQISATHTHSPMKLQLNDDRGEKAARLQSRQALQEMHMNEIRAAASPMRKLNQNRARQSTAATMDSEPSTPEPAHIASRPKGRKQQIQAESQPAQASEPLDPLSAREGALTPLKRLPILANFEEWMKLATDNKINATNSWNFALIDYFHDMSLLKDGPKGEVNFQKASVTLDGCVKVYTSRVDSVATETGRLLSGLAESAENKSKRRGDNADDENGEEDEEEEEADGEGAKKKKKKTTVRSYESTLAPSFASLQLKKLELEFAVDPLFKKASADFDEGGAKGLLLNHLSIDSAGRIVFDSSDDAEDAQMKQDSEQNEQNRDEKSAERDLESGTDGQVAQEPDADEEIDLGSLGASFFPDLASLDHKDICPSMKSFTLGASDLTIPLIKAPEDWRAKQKSPEKPSIPMHLDLADQTGIFLDGSNDMGFDDDDGAIGGFDMDENIGFGEGGEAWAKDAAAEPQARVGFADEVDPNLIEGDNPDGHTIVLQHRYREDVEQANILEYFDKAFNSRSKGKAAFATSLENWRIQKIQKARHSEVNAAQNGPERKRKEKEPFEIDFTGPMSDNLRELLAAPPVNNSTISLPRTQLKTKGRNLLDKDDEVVDVRSMMRLWTKPKCYIGRRKGAMELIDEGFGSRARLPDTSDPTANGRPSTAQEDEDEIEGQRGDYDANFFADDEPLPLMFEGPLPIDDDDDDDNNHDNGEPGFVDAREMLSPGPALNPHQELDGDGVGNLDEMSSQQQSTDPQLQGPASQLLPGSFGAQLITQQGRRARPEFVNYARTAKKVDVRVLKENMWKGMSDKLIASMPLPNEATGPARPPTPALTDGDGDTDMADADADTDANPPPGDASIAPPTAVGAPAPVPGKQHLNFTEMISDLRTVYPETEMKDISTSYCFICLLHLANEKGLVLEGGREEGTMGEIVVRRDEGVGEGYVGE